MKSLKTFLLVLFLGSLLAACAAPTPSGSQPTLSPTSNPTTRPTPAPTQSGGDVVPQVVTAIKTFAAQQFGVSLDSIKILKLEPVEWPDACIGASQPGEMCAQVITPGYKIQVEINGKTTIVNSDSSGKVIRIPTAPATSLEPKAVADAARNWLANTLKLDVNAIQVVSITPQQWPDGCLGIRKPGIACTDMIVPGYRVIIQAMGVQYELRTNQTGSTIVMADQPGISTTPKSPVLGSPVFGWNSGGNPCGALQIAGSLAAFGPCGSTPRVVPLPNPVRRAELDTFLKNYTTFTAQTPAGEVTLTGSGTVQPSPFQQRALGEWAQMVYLEVSSPDPMPNIGLALTWHREGGIAGFCDDLKIYRSGLAVATSCKGNQQLPTGTTWLTEAQLTPFFTWLDQLQASDYKSNRPGCGRRHDRHLDACRQRKTRANRDRTPANPGLRGPGLCRGG